MGLDGARSATRRLLECVTCATRVTRATFDFQEGDGFELRDKEFARKFQVQSAKAAFKAKVSPTRRTRRTLELNSSAQPCHCWLQGCLQARSTQSSFEVGLMEREARRVGSQRV